MIDPSASPSTAAQSDLDEPIEHLLRDNLRTLQAQLSGMFAARQAELEAAYAQRLGQVQTQLQAVSQHSRELEQNMAQLREELQIALTRFESEQRAHAQALVEKTALETQLEKTLRDHETQASRLEASEQEGEQLRQALQRAQQHASEQAAQRQAEAAALAASSEQAQQLGEQLEAAQRAVEQQQGQLADVTAERDEIQQQLAQQAAQHNAECQTHEAAIDELRQELERLNGSLGEANSRLSEMKIQLWNVEAEREELHKANNDLGSQLRTQEQQMAEQSRTLQQLNEREQKSSLLISDAKEVLAESKQNIARLEDKLRELKGENNDLRIHLASARAGQRQVDQA